MLLYRNISNALITYFLNLQFKDTWCKKKEWEVFSEGKITKGQFKSMWRVNHVNLMWCDSTVYVSDHTSTKTMILCQNHDDLWEGGHFDIKWTLSMIWKFYWWLGMVQTVWSYCETCDSCQRMKTHSHKSYNNLLSLSKSD